MAKIVLKNPYFEEEIKVKEDYKHILKINQHKTDWWFNL